MKRKTNLEAMRGAITREALAASVGCSAEQIRKLEAGFSNPGLELARRIAAALGASVDAVFPPRASRRAEAGNARRPERDREVR